MKNIIFTFCFTLVSVFLFAQSSSIKGKVLDEETGEPIIYGNVYLDGTTLGTNTDDDGFFILTGLDAGTYTLVIKYLGYTDSSTEIVLEKGQSEFKNINLKSEGVSLNVVQVDATAGVRKEEVHVSKLSVSVSDLKSLPATGGEPDIAQYLPVLPGIIFSGDQGGQLYIRGGSPVQNKIMIDGMTIVNPFHSIGFFSVFETETIKNVDVLTGGFGAKYGGRISAVVDIKTREGNKKRTGGLVSVSPFQAKVLIEGPIKKLTDSGSSVSYMLTGKKALLPETSKSLYSHVNEGAGLPFDYNDLYGKISFNASQGNKLDVFGFSFNDNVDYSIAKLNWDTYGGGIKFSVVPSLANMVINGKLNYSLYDLNLTELDDKTRRSSIGGVSGGLDFTYYGNKQEINYGFELNTNDIDFEFDNVNDYTFKEKNNTTQISAYFDYQKHFGDLIVNGGVRLPYYASSSKFYVEPRLAMKYKITDKFRMKAGAGLYSQNLMSTVNENDVVNLFVGFLAEPDEQVFELNTKNTTDSKLQTAFHIVSGFEYDVNNFIQLNVEPYWKHFNQIIGLNRNKTEVSDSDYSTEEGDAYGIDLSGRYKKGDIYVWMTYSYAHVNRFDGEQTYPTIFDRRHNVNFLTTYSFGKNKSWEASARWNMGSGFPFTLTQGFYEDVDVDGGIGTNFLTQNGNLGIIYDEVRNAGRLPYYHRLDLSIKKAFKFSKYMTLDVIASATNAYNRENIFYFDRVTADRVNQLPILPSLSATFRF